MDRNAYTSADYRQPHVPPATPPVIDSNADASDAALLTMDDGDSNAPGSKPAHFNRGREDDGLFDGGDRDEPGKQPDEVSPDQGDFDTPDNAPSEVPPQPDTGPIETPAPD